MRKKQLSTNTLILLVTAFIALSGNAALVSSLLQAYPLSAGNIAALLSLVIVFGGITVLILSLLCFGKTTKPVLITVLLLSAAAAYFMDSFGVIISDDMLRNIAHTNTAEALELFSLKLLAYLLLLGAGPAFAVAKIPLASAGGRSELFSRLKLAGITVVLIAGTVLLLGGFYASFLREHKDIRQRVNPNYYLYSTVRFLLQSIPSSGGGLLAQIGSDAAIPVTDVSRDLVIMVVGETARADRFSLNGYARETNPQLAKRDVISFPNFWACGTSTAVSVPCMFLLDGEAKPTSFINSEENLLDVLKHGGVHVLWLDNNSDSKGVASRAEFRDFRSPKVNPVCDTECRDEGMLSVLQEYIDSRPSGDIFIVLHQMGNHGPAYHRRYPPEFEKFKPACKESDLSRCSREEIGNAYDNAILYTDHFLAKAIDLLKKNDSKFETALFYVSDHGESLGEGGLYLHGLPKTIAPEAQLRVPAVMWFGSKFRAVDVPALKKKVSNRFTHNNVFHTILGFFEIETAAYVSSKDILDQAKPVKK